MTPLRPSSSLGGYVSNNITNVHKKSVLQYIRIFKIGCNSATHYTNYTRYSFVPIDAEKGKTIANNIQA